MTKIKSSKAAIFGQTYSSPTKRYILLCNKAQIVCEIKVCVISHGTNQQTWPLSPAKPPKPLLLRGGGGGKTMLFKIAK